MKKPENKSGGLWLSDKLDELYGESHGRNSRFIDHLKACGHSILHGSLTVYCSAGLPITTLGSTEILSMYAEALDCSVADILISHGFRLDNDSLSLGFDPNVNSDISRIISILSNYQDNEKMLSHMRRVLDLLVKKDADD